MTGDVRDEIVGRKAELSVLATFLDEVPDGPAALVLSGDAGVGKTTLWREGLEAARARSYQLLVCQPVESEAKLSFAALGDLLGGVADEVVGLLPSPQARALDVALLRVEPEGTAPDNRAVSLAVLEAIRALSSHGPVVLAVDDVQWLDAPSSRVLEFALRRLQAEPVGVLATSRPGGSDEPTVPLGLDRYLPERRLRRLDVGPLDVDALGSLLRDRLGQAFLRSTLVRLHEMSGGNPFFAIEIARASLRGNKPASGQLLPVPQSLRELVRRRVSALPADAREALLAAAAVSSPSVDLVNATVGGRRKAADALAKGVEAGVIEVEEGQIRFAHPLFGSAIFSEASSEQRRALHRRLAGIVIGAEERARHLALAVDGPDPEGRRRWTTRPGAPTRAVRRMPPRSCWRWPSGSLLRTSPSCGGTAAWRRRSDTTFPATSPRRDCFSRTWSGSPRPARSGLWPSGSSARLGPCLRVGGTRRRSCIERSTRPARTPPSGP
jgi:hypothetical protein